MGQEQVIKHQTEYFRINLQNFFLVNMPTQSSMRSLQMKTAPMRIMKLRLKFPSILEFVRYVFATKICIYATRIFRLRYMTG